MLRYLAGKPTRLPYRVTRQLVAARYGQRPSDVDGWPADDFADAAALLQATGVNLGGTE